MADRSVLVRLKADISDYQRKISTAAATTGAFVKRLDQADSRLANIVQTGLALAPAFVPIGGLAVPAVAGLAAQLGFAATAGGVALVAFQGIGGALDALNKYQLEPTAANFAKLQAEMDTLGPQGREFVRFLQDLRPEMQQLQNIAQAGFFPGLMDGIDEALKLTPQVEQLIDTVSTTMGSLFREAGDNLNDPRWVSFFEFLDREAGPTLTAMGRSFGNIVEGLAAMLQAFDPLTDRFTSGMLEMSQSFNRWAQGLDSSEGFQEFLDYIEETGPEALETLGAIGNALVELVEAAAPVGRATLPIIEGLADGLAAIADSPIGPLLIGTAAAVGVLGRSIALLRTVGLVGGRESILTSILGTSQIKPGITMLREATVATQGLTMAQKANVLAAVAQEKAVRTSVAQIGKNVALLGGLAVATTGVADKTGLANTATLGLMGTIAGPYGAAIGAGIGLTMDLAHANDDLESAMKAVDRAARSGDMRAQRQTMRDLNREISEVRENMDQFWSLDRGGEGLLETIQGDMQAIGAFFSNSLGKAVEKQAFLREEMKATGGLAELFGETMGQTGDRVRILAGDVDTLTGALARLEGFLDKRAAIRNYQESLDELRKALRKNADAWDADTAKGRLNLEMLDATADGVLQMVENTKGARAKDSIIARYHDQLLDLQKRFPSARAAIGQIIARLEKLGLIDAEPKVKLDTDEADRKSRRLRRDLDDLDGVTSTPKVDADNDEAREKTEAVDRWLAELTGTTARPKIIADAGQAFDAISAVRYALGQLQDKHITVTTSYLYKRAAIEELQTRAGGGQVFGPGGPRDDRVPALLSNREWVMPVAAVDHYGPSFMSDIQHRRLPGRDTRRAIAQAALDRKAMAASPGGGRTVRHIIEVRVAGDLDLTRARAQIVGIAERVSRDEIDDNQAWEHDQGFTS